MTAPSLLGVGGLALEESTTEREPEQAYGLALEGEPQESNRRGEGYFQGIVG